MKKEVKKYLLTHPQKRIWFEEKINNTLGCNILLPMITIDENIDLEIMEKAINIVIKNNDAMRTKIFEVDGIPYQSFRKYEYEKIDYFDFSSSDTNAELEGLIEKMYNSKFEVLDSKLYYFSIIKINNNKIGILLKIHHIIADTSTVSIIFNNIMDYYYKLQSNIVSDNIKKDSYISFIEDENQYKGSEKFNLDNKYWIDKLSDSECNGDIGIKKFGSNLYKVESMEYNIPEQITDLIYFFAEEYKTSIYRVFNSIVFLLFAKMCMKEKLILGTVLHNRFKEEYEDIAGMFVSTVPFSIKANEDMSFIDIINQNRNELKEIIQHQEFPFDVLLQQMGGVGKNKDVIQAMVVYHNEKYFNNTNIHYYKIGEDVFPITFHIGEFNKKHRLKLYINYKDNYFTSEAIELIFNRLMNISEKVLKNPNICFKDISIILPTEKENIFKKFNNSKAEYPKDKTLQDLFEEQVKRVPNNIALIYENERITYQELNEKTNKLARYLRKSGVDREKIVGIMTTRSIDMVVGILGILKAGGAYMPIDPSYPEERKRYMLEDSKAGVLLVQDSSGLDELFDGKVININDNEINNESNSNLDIERSSRDLAYIIYTSGSTGKPKGVMIEHRSAINTLMALEKKYPLSQEDTYLLKTSYTFDVSVTELFGWFISGGRLAILRAGGEKEPQVILDTINKNNVTHINFVPSMLSVFIDVAKNGNLESIKKLKYIFAAGEALSVDLVKRFLELGVDVQLEDIYGPTEAAIYAVGYSIKDIGDEPRIPIGRVLDNTRAYIVDQNNNLMPIGIPGELCIAGDGLARGYLNKEELTREKFVDNPFEKDGKMYKTGDLARWLPNGNIDFIGRIDNQVKIRGFRIELGEIETALLKYEDIKEAAVITKNDENGHKYLSAYVVSSKELLVSDLRKHLSKAVPEYMIPTQFIQLEQMPLNQSGKIDRKELAKLEGEMTTGVEYVAPRDEVEKKLEEIWSEILDVENIGVYDNFFDLGGHSLKATVLASRVQREFSIEVSVKDIFDNTTIDELSKYIKQGTVVESQGIVPIEKQEYYDVSASQKRMYIVNKMTGENIGYNIPMAMEIKGHLDVARFEETINKLVNRHESFRTFFEMIDNKPVQKIAESIDFKIDYIEEAEKVDEVIKEYIKPFDLSKAPLIRVALIKVKEDSHVLVMDMHHIISDGVSLGVIFKEVAAIYKEEKLDDLKLQYKDFSAWQNEYLRSDKIKKQEAYWLDVFSGELPVLDIMTDYERPTVQSFKGKNISFNIQGKIVDGLKSISEDTNTTMYMLLLAAYNVLLSKYSSQEDIIVGSPIAGRTQAEAQDMIGMFVNTLAMRNRPERDKTFRTFLGEVKENSLRAYENQEYQFEELVDKLEIVNDISRNPLFDTMFVLQNMDMSDITIDNLVFKNYAIEYEISKYDFTLFAVEDKDRINFNFEYSTDLYKEETIRKLCNHYVNILQSIVNSIDVKLSDIEMITAEEKKKVIEEFNETESVYPSDKTIQELFEEQVERNPESIAVVYEDSSLTYRELNCKANKLARSLREKGVERDSIVGIIADKSLEMIIGTLAIIKAGGAYLPIDSKYPEERIEFMLKDGNVKVLLGQDNLVNKLGNYNGEILRLEDIDSYNQDESNLLNINTNRDLCYVIYTSGTTGNPKGVMVEHKNVVRLIKNTNYIEFSDGDRILQTGSLAFDASTFEIWGSLLNGLRLYLAESYKILNAESLKDLINKNNINILWLTSPLFNQLAQEDSGIFKNLKYLLVGGDALVPSNINRVRKVCENTTIINGYGPTENTTFSVCCQIDKEYEKNIPIGKPISNSTAYIVDKSGAVQPIGVPGELWVGGDGIARGYLNREDLTEEKFINSPFKNGERIYKTGDLTRWLPDGKIEFIGRVDDQVKIRGFRIEPKEIEEKLLRNEFIDEVIVLPKENQNNEKYLCAYISGKKELTVVELRQYLEERLPKYMIPSYFIQLEKMPLNKNGKIDKSQLPEPDGDINTGREYVAPRNDVEKKLVEVWQEVLGVEKVGINDDFFEIGGDSLKAVRVSSKLSLEYKVNANDIFVNPTIEKLAKKLGKFSLIEEITKLLESTKRENNKVIDEKIQNSIKRYKEYSYSKYCSKDISKTKSYKNILLCGATGYLGINVLKELLKNTKSDILLIVRPKINKTSKERVAEKFKFYFDDNLYNKYKDRIIILEGDITKNNLGLSENNYKMLSDKVECIINSAANVSHYGRYEELHQINVIGTKNLLKLSSEGLPKDYNHISTLSVASGIIKNKSVQLFTEDNYDLGQKSDNYYVKTKQEAEAVVLDARKNGVNCNIFRVGNIVFNSENGRFQQNIEDNSFYKIIKSYIKIGSFPSNENMVYDFTFVDYVSKAITLLYDRNELKDETYHIFNSKMITITYLGKVISEVIEGIEVIEFDKFIKRLKEKYDVKELKEYIENILFNYSSVFNESTSFKVLSDKTELILRKLGFEWSDVTKKNIKDMINYCIKREYI